MPCYSPTDWIVVYADRMFWTPPRKARAKVIGAFCGILWVASVVLLLLLDMRDRQRFEIRTGNDVAQLAQPLGEPNVIGPPNAMGLSPTDQFAVTDPETLRQIRAYNRRHITLLWYVGACGIGSGLLGLAAFAATLARDQRTVPPMYPAPL